MRQAKVASVLCGEGQPLLLIAGPCVLVDDGVAMNVARELARLQEELEIQVVFKASFDKANRSSGGSYRGVGLDRGLEILKSIHQETGLPTTTDVHVPEQVPAVADVVDLIQIPAFLCRQTDLLLAAGGSGRPVHVKKGQFLAPWDMSNVLEKLRSVGCTDILIGERGTCFGYGRLINDMTAIPYMQSLGVPVIFDATHSVQLPGSLGHATGGNREMIPPLARAAVAVGADGLFLETYPDPAQSPSDGPNMLPLDAVRPLLKQLLRIRAAALACLIVAACLLTTLTGCRRDVQIATGEAEMDQRAVAAMRKDHIRRALAFLRDFDRFQTDALRGRVLHHLRKWTEDQPPEVDWFADPMFANLPPRLGINASTIGLSRRRFLSSDVQMLREALWLRDLARRLAKSPRIDADLAGWLDSEAFSGGTQEREDLKTVAALFDWVVCNVQLEPLYLTTEERESTVDEPLAERPGVRRSAWEALLLSRGDALCRARLVVLLARQLEIPVVLLAEDDSRESPPWALAAHIGEELYLFDPHLGLPMPGAEGRGILTLRELLQKPETLRNWDLPSGPYPVSDRQLASLVAYVDAPPEYLSQRMRWLELALPTAEKMILTCQPAAIRKRLETHPGIDRIAIWTQPYEVELLRIRLQQFPTLLEQTNRDLALLSPPWPLSFARGQHIRGIFRDIEYSEGAKELYMRVRLSDAQINGLRTREGMQKLLVSLLGVQYALPEESDQFRAMRAQIREVLFAMRGYASMGLGQIALETEDYETAREFFAHRVLEDDRAQDWYPGARYCLGRSLEAMGRLQNDVDLLRQAIEAYRSDRISPQARGNELRALLLERVIDRSSSPTAVSSKTAAPQVLQRGLSP